MIKDKDTIKIVSGLGNSYFLNPDEKYILGKGSFGIVYKGSDSKNNTVAIKIFNSSKVYATIRETLGTVGGTIGNEIAAFKALNPCANTVKIFDSGILKSKGLIIMEYCEGGSLDALIKKNGAFPPQKALSIIKQISKGLSDIHNLGIMHRDLKPANILISKGEYKIGDFGLVSSKTIEKGLSGTHLYMAPEVKQERSYNKSVDIYSLGLILKELLTGKYPCEINDQDMKKFHSKLVDFISKMTHSDSKKRLTARDANRIASELESQYSRGVLKDPIVVSESPSWKSKSTKGSPTTAGSTNSSACSIDFRPIVGIDFISPLETPKKINSKVTTGKPKAVNKPRPPWRDPEIPVRPSPFDCAFEHIFSDPFFHPKVDEKGLVYRINIKSGPYFKFEDHGPVGFEALKIITNSNLGGAPRFTMIGPSPEAVFSFLHSPFGGFGYFGLE